MKTHNTVGILMSSAFLVVFIGLIAVSIWLADSGMRIILSIGGTIEIQDRLLRMDDPKTALLDSIDDDDMGHA